MNCSGLFLHSTFTIKEWYFVTKSLWTICCCRYTIHEKDWYSLLKCPLSPSLWQRSSPQSTWPGWRWRQCSYLPPCSQPGSTQLKYSLWLDFFITCYSHFIDKLNKEREDTIYHKIPHLLLLLWLGRFPEKIQEETFISWHEGWLIYNITQTLTYVRSEKIKINLRRRVKRETTIGKILPWIGKLFNSALTCTNISSTFVGQLHWKGGQRLLINIPRWKHLQCVKPFFHEHFWSAAGHLEEAQALQLTMLEGQPARPQSCTCLIQSCLSSNL